ncbi:hypothetical protein A2Z33_02790 [Candidatus Gottesmanbacteria bacterium RBG_16_52_11]|uniref:Uncharacterized protein n=1 Tax=Candidatus Gottesmanbacteria bacterium RBG_16_52_11 TaxID=1798374 RepID=A0A1F5YN91_9BACT|nr:MAG: hypothetical protein A2Z33_02790 [Candidatus Gottesmanbacteria bacterium RBG_16_52_11]
MRPYVLPTAIVLAILLNPAGSYAATIQFTSATGTMTADQDLEVNATLSISQTDGTQYYLRGVFSRPDTDSYCGFTWNGSTWYSGPVTSGEGWKNFLQVIIREGSWSGILKARIDRQSAACNTSGPYDFKIMRYTQSGNATTEGSSVASLAVTIATPTLSPVPTGHPTNTPRPDPESGISDTPELTPSVTKRPELRLTPTKKPVMTAAGFRKDTATVAAATLNDVLPLSEPASMSPEGSSASGMRIPVSTVALAFIGSGLAVLSAAMAYRKSRNVSW